MAETTWTPGTWTVTHNSWEVSTVYGLNGAVVAECNIDCCVDEETQDKFEAIKEANAQLIAAAPDLYGALERAEIKLKAYVGVCTGDKELTNTLLPMVRAALSRARGETG